MAEIIKKNEEILCRICNKYFLFTIGEQKFYERKRLCKPKQCPDCKEKYRDIKIIGPRGYGVRKMPCGVCVNSSMYL